MKAKKGIQKMMSVLCAGITLVSVGAASAQAITTDTGVGVRDPFVLEADGTYYMYGTGLAWPGYGCVSSTDLVNWSAPAAVFTPPAGFDGCNDWWAPECHFYNGNYYLFATYRSAASDKRGVGIFRSASPAGPFELITDGHITPKAHDAIDGTLYVDDNGTPWMIYVNEWTSNEDRIGDMMLAQLKSDLTAFVSEPVMLFRANAAPWAADGITDGPFLYKTKNGRLLMLWSNFNDNGYAVGIAYSSNGRVDGTWFQQPTPLYQGGKNRLDGGHGMLFRDKNGQLTLSMHSPNGSTEEHPTTAVFLSVDDIGDTLVLSGNNNFFVRLYYKVYYAITDFFHSFGMTC